MAVMFVSTLSVVYMNDEDNYQPNTKLFAQLALNYLYLGTYCAYIRENVFCKLLFVSASSAALNIPIAHENSVYAKLEFVSI